MKPFEVRSAETQFLVDQFLTTPGVEGEAFDAKSREAVESKSGRQKVVRHATAISNSGGGVLIVGADDDRDIIQGFEITNETKTYLINIARERTTPPIPWEMTFDEYSGERQSDHGKYLFRIDIKSAERTVDQGLVRFRPNGDWNIYHRDGDNTVRMSDSDIAEFYEKKSERREEEILQDPTHLVREVDLQFSTPGESPVSADHHRSDGRPTMLCGIGSVGVPFSSAIDSFDKRTIYSLSSNITVYEFVGLRHILQSLSEHLGADFNENFGYAIKDAEYFWADMGVENFLTDSISIYSDNESVRQSISSREDMELREASDPSIVFCTETEYGLFWLEVRAARWDDESEETDFYPGFCGLLLNDLPFDKEPIRKFYQTIDKYEHINLRDGVPNSYRQQNTLLKVKFWGNDIQLNNAYPLDYIDTTQQPRYVYVDNPLYGRSSDLNRVLDKPIPAPFDHGITSIDKIPLFVSGSPSKIDFENLTLNFVEFTSVGYLDSSNDILLVHGVCRTRN